MRALWVFGLLVTTGCFQYTPMTAPAPEVGSTVRIDLTDAGSVRLAPTIGQRIESIDGQSVATSDTSLALNVLATISQSGIVAHWNKERVDVPRSAISQIRGRRLDTKRSLLAGALTVIGALAVGQAFGLDLGSIGLGSGSGSGTTK
jgi:hypothetical protein